MSLLAMPFLVINYGGEMIYILEQRLHSQQIKSEKAQKVLHDLARALFNEPFFAELLRPQPLYTFVQTREVCDKLAQSSIMKLSSDSMDKLFDLVVMGVKYQTVSCRHPCELIDITLNHIDYIANLVKASSTSSDAVGKARTAFAAFAKELSVAEYAQIRQALLSFAVHKRVKVSLFLQEKMQHSDGRFVIPAGGALPNEQLSREPGEVAYADGGCDSFDYPLAKHLEPKLGGDPYDAETRDSKLGHNLYTIDRKRAREGPDAGKGGAAPPPAHGSTGSTAAAQKAPPCRRGAHPASAGRGGEEVGMSSRPMSAGAAELNHLNQLLGCAHARPATAQSFKIGDLFDQAGGGASADGGGAGGGTEQICIPRMTRDDLEKHNRELVAVMSGLEIAQGDTSAGDLADLFDQVAEEKA